MKQEGPTLIFEKKIECGNCCYIDHAFSDWNDWIRVCSHESVSQKHPESRQLLNSSTPKWCPLLKVVNNV